MNVCEHRTIGTFPHTGRKWKKLDHIVKYSYTEMSCREVVAAVTDVTAHVKQYWTVSTSSVWLTTFVPYFSFCFYTNFIMLFASVAMESSHITSKSWKDCLSNPQSVWSKSTH